MTAQHQQFATLATRLIAKNGRPLALVKRTPSGLKYEPTFDIETASIIGVQLMSVREEYSSNLIASTAKEFLIDSKVRIEMDMRIAGLAKDDDGNIVMIPLGVWMAGAGLACDQIPLGEWRAGIDAYGGDQDCYDASNEPQYSIIKIKEIMPGATSIVYKVSVAV